MRMNMKIGTKLIACTAVVVGCAMLLGLAACFSVRGLGKAMDNIVHVTTTRRTVVGELNTVATGLLAQERGIVLASILQQQAAVQQYKDQVQDLFARSDSLFRQFDATLQPEDDRSTSQKLQDEFRAVRRGHDELMQYIERQQFDQVQKVSDDRVLPKLLVITSECERLVQVESENLATVARDVGSRSTMAWWLMLFLIALCAVTAFPVLQVIRGTNKKLRFVALQMAEGSEQVANAASEVSSASQSLAQNASEQAASLEETAASSEEITSMTQKNADNSRQVSELMAQVDANVSEANRTLGEMVSSMRDITASSDRISKIIKVIDEIAFQTNILALNAAVEAARAGEAGMGFAVVADEVRNLAQRCAQAAKDTADLIEESIAKSSGGSTKLGQMESAIQAITQSATKVRTLVDEVSLGSQEQARGIQHIAKSISRMEGMTQKTAASAEESASASEELSAQAKNMEVLVFDLRGMVDGGDARTEHPHRSAAARPVSMHTALKAREERAAPKPVMHKAEEAPMPKRKVNGHAALTPPPVDSFPMDEDFKEF